MSHRLGCGRCGSGCLRRGRSHGSGNLRGRSHGGRNRSSRSGSCRSHRSGNLRGRSHRSGTLRGRSPRSGNLRGRSHRSGSLRCRGLHRGDLGRGGRNLLPALQAGEASEGAVVLIRGRRLLALLDPEATALIGRRLGGFGGRNAVGLKQSFGLDLLELVQGGHVALRLAKSEVSKLGRQVLAGHAVLLREIVDAYLVAQTFGGGFLGRSGGWRAPGWPWSSLRSASVKITWSGLRDRP